MRKVRILKQGKSLWNCLKYTLSLSLDLDDFSLGKHPCDRDCSSGDAMTCTFNFTAEVGYTVDDPEKRGADGRNRSVITYNGQLPGPLLVVCEGDTVIVSLENKIVDGPITNSDGSPNTTTLHFHGIRQVGRSSQTTFGPWADGVPYVNQCPIGPGKTFKYKFEAKNIEKDCLFGLCLSKTLNAPPGSYWYHSHIGSQRTNGLQGGLIIKPKHAYIYKNQRVIDEPSMFTVVIQEWYESPTRQVPMSILINGKGRVGYFIFDSDDLDLTNNYLRGLGATFNTKPNPHQIHHDTNYAAFDLEKGYTYRFRLLGLIGQNLPIRVSIDNKENGQDSSGSIFKFVAISTDSLDIKPIENLDFLWLSPGERYDILFTLPEDVPDKAIKMRFIGYTDLNGLNNRSAICTVAHLRFPGSPVDLDYTLQYGCPDFPYRDNIFPNGQRVLNPPPKASKQMAFFDKIDDIYSNPNETGNIFPVDITSREVQIPFIDPLTAHETEFIEFFPSTTFNGIRTEFPRVPYLLQDPEDDAHRCDIKNRDSKDFYKIQNQAGGNSTFCEHVLRFRDGSVLTQEWQEIVLINNGGDSASHPIHQHGGWFWIAGEGQFKHEINRTFIVENFESLKSNVNNATRRTTWNWPDIEFDILPKDVIQVPNQGYVIIRTHLDNPGTFIFHCHIDFHLSIGMGLGKYL